MVDGLEKKIDFFKYLCKVVQYGFDIIVVLKVLIYILVELVQVMDYFGGLEKGKLVNFIVIDGFFFGDGVEIYQIWVKGKVYIYKVIIIFQLIGQYNFKVGSDIYVLEIIGIDEKFVVKINIMDFIFVKVKLERVDELLIFFFVFDFIGQVCFFGIFNGCNWSGCG